MPPAPFVIARGTFAGATATLNVTQPVTQNGVLQLFWTTYVTGEPNWSSVEVLTATDSKGGDWVESTFTLPLVGIVGVDNSFDSSVPQDLFAGSVARRCDPANFGEAYLDVGDTIDVTMFSNQGFEALFTTNVIVAWVPTKFVTVRWDGTIVYSNSDQYWPGLPGFGSSNPQALTWGVDGFVYLPNPDQLAFGYAVFASAPGELGPTSHEGWTLLDEMNSNHSIHVFYKHDLPADVDVDPGITWPTAGHYMTCGNYQFAVPGDYGAASVFWFYKDGVWRQAGNDPEYNLWYYQNGVWTPHDPSTPGSMYGVLGGSWQQ